MAIIHVGDNAGFLTSRGGCAIAGSDRFWHGGGRAIGIARKVPVDMLDADNGLRGIAAKIVMDSLL